jgi:phenylalanyl-tRNA synthetase beta chain
MKVSLEWLRTLVPFTQGAAELRDLITMRAATVDELVPLRQDLAPIVVARVVECARHPDSDRLSVTKVDAGTGELLDVVCGAPNVAVGKLYPFARTGVTVPNGVLIQKRKIRGAVSNGMLCSERELLLGEDQAGIMELEVDVAPGTPLLDVLSTGDFRLVIDVGANRPDLLSHVGVAREIAAATGVELQLPPLGELGDVPQPRRSRDSGETGGVSVTLADPALARRYMGVVISGVTVGPSPEWLVRRLEAVGSRSINNVVDATNYVLLELGQPTHAFDLARLRGSEIRIRAANQGERIKTLDGVERVLDESITVIADADRPVAIAGIMGGADSEVAESTREIFLEVATFDAQRTRTARRKLGLSTDASYRFERGVDVLLPPQALERCARLITEVAGGTIRGAPLDLMPEEPQRRAVKVRVDRVARVLGEAIRREETERLLSSVGFEVIAGTDEALSIAPPGWRADVAGEIDLIEEVARLRGYETFGAELRPQLPSNVPDDPQWLLAGRLTELLTSLGMHEVRPMPFTAGADDSHVRVANPLAENEAHLRRELLETLSRRVEFNLSHMQRNVRLFEVGAAFEPAGSALPREELRIAAVITGARVPGHFSLPDPPDYDAWDAKWLAEQIGRAAYASAELVLDPAADGPELWTVVADRLAIGSVRRLEVDAPVWAAPVFGIEISLGMIDSTPPAAPGENVHFRPGAVLLRPTARRYRPLPSTPPATFDLAFIVPAGVAVAKVEDAITRAAGELLESVELFDLYSGPGVPEGHRSAAWRLTLRHPDRTLRDREIEGRRAGIIASLEKELDVRQRSA